MSDLQVEVLGNQIRTPEERSQNVIGGGQAPSLQGFRDFGSRLSGAVSSLFDRGEPTETPSAPSLVKGSPAEGRKAGGGFTMGTDGRAKPEVSLTPGQTLGLAALSTGLQTVGAIQNMRQEEQDTINMIQQKHQLDMDQIEFQSNMAESVQAVSSLRNTLARVRGVARQAQGGGIQRQQFIRDPGTGRLV